MSAAVYAFGPFHLEVDERRLVRDGAVVPLTAKSFELLQVLVEGAGTLLKQQALIERLWPDVVVDANNLPYTMSLVRKAVANAPGVVIETVRGQGYRLVADVELLRSPSRERTPATEVDQQIRFCTSSDGARLAYAVLGEGPPVVKAASWLSHLEMDRAGPMWRHWLAFFGGRGAGSFVRYDSRGNGLSDRSPPRIAFEDLVDDLAAVFDAAEIERAPVLGISQGAAAAVAYAARHPERVSALILVGGCARGWRVKNHARLTERFEALMALMRQGWGGRNAAFRQLFTTSFFPQAPKDQMEWFNELQRRTASPENAAAILSALGDVDIRSDMKRIDVPTIVLHSREDAVVPMSDGIELASGIRGARFVPIESPNHVLLAEEPGWERFTREVDAFLRDVPGKGRPQVDPR